MKSGQYRFLLRMPEPLRERLVDAAARSGRSLNGELVHRLEQSLDPPASLASRSSRIAVRAVAAVAAFLALVGAGSALGRQVANATQQKQRTVGVAAQEYADVLLAPHRGGFAP